MGKKGEGVCPHCRKLTPEGSKSDFQIGINIKEIEAVFEKMREHVADLEHAKDGLTVAAVMETLWGKPVYPKRFVDRFTEDAKRSREAIDMCRRQLLYAIEVVKLSCRAQGHDHERDEAERVRIKKELAKAHGEHPESPWATIPVFMHDDCHERRVYSAWQAWLADIDAKVMAESIVEAAKAKVEERAERRSCEAPPATDVEQTPTASPEPPGLKIKPLLKDIEGPPF